MSTYYVRTSGSDSADGLSPANAWETVGKARDTVGDNDIVYIGPGDYSSEELYIAANRTGQSWLGDPKGSVTGDVAGEIRIKCIYDNGNDWTDTIFRYIHLTGGCPAADSAYSLVIKELESGPITVDKCILERALKLSFRDAKTVTNCVINLSTQDAYSCYIRNNSTDTDSQENYIENNVIYQGYPGDYAALYCWDASGNAEFILKWYIRNNIIHQTPGPPVYFIHLLGWADDLYNGYTDWNLDYNFFEYTGLFGRWQQTGYNGAPTFDYMYDTLTEWQAVGFGASSLEGDPTFDSDGYHVLKSSPCINAGVNTGHVQDIDGNIRPIGDYDIGAHEFQPSAAIYGESLSKFCMSRSTVQVGTALEALLRAVYLTGTWQGFLGLNTFNQNVLIGSNEIKKHNFWNKVISYNLVFNPGDYV